MPPRTHPKLLSSTHDFVSNDVTIRRRRLTFSAHLSRAGASQDHSRALQVCILGPPKDLRRRNGIPRQSRLRTVKNDLRPPNFGLATATRHDLNRPAWRLLVETAIHLYLTMHAPERDRERPTTVPPTHLHQHF